MARSVDPTLGPAIVREATRLGIDPADLATAIGYETVGTYSTDIRGGAGNRYFGLIQFGPAEQKHYGIKPGMSADDQMVAVGNYLQDRGLKPGMGLADIYSTINAGSPGHYGARDASGLSVAQHVARMQQNYGPEARDMVSAASGYAPGGGEVAPSAEDASGIPIQVYAPTQQAAAPAPGPIPAGPYGADKVVAAMARGDVQGAQKALGDLKMAAAASFSFSNGIEKIKADVTNYFKSQLPVVQAAFSKYPALAKAVPADMKPAVDAARQAVPAAPSAQPGPADWAINDVPTSVDINDAGQAQVYGAAPNPSANQASDFGARAPDVYSGIQPQPVDPNTQAPTAAYTRTQRAADSFRPNTEAQRQTIRDRATGGGSLFGGGSDDFLSSKPPDAIASSWGKSQPSDITPYASTPYPKAEPAAPATGDALTAAPTLAKALVSGSFMGGNGMTATDPLTVAQVVPTVAGVNKPAVAAGPVKPATLTSALVQPAPKAKQLASFGPAGKGPWSSPSLGGGFAGFGISPSVAAAAKAAGFATSPFTPAGYNAPNFSTGSGGSLFATNRNVGGTTTDVHGNTVNVGTYINSQGKPMTYTWSPSGAA